MSGFETHLSRYRELVDDWPAFLEACRRPLPRVIWANPLRRPPAARWSLPDEAIAALLTARGIRVQPLSWLPGAYRVEGLSRPGHMLEHYLGWLHVQEEVSLIPPVLLGALPGERVLDLCAAPGGKTVRIAVGMANRGTLVANDVQPQRLRALRSNCERLGAMNVVVTPIDGTRFPLQAGPFDRILLDAPCSCEGNVRGDPATAQRQVGEALRGRSGLQATLLGRAWKLLAPGGTLVYATCTFAPEENEIVLDAVLGDEARIMPLQMEGLRYAAGVDSWQGRTLRRDCRHVARFWPHLNDTGGFTVAVVRKQGNTASGGDTGGELDPVHLPAAAEDREFGAFRPLQDRGPIERWCERFATDPAVFEGLALYQRGTSSLWIGADAVQLGQLPRVDGVGIPFVRVNGKVWKPTTVAALQFGHHARRNTIELDEAAARALLRRDPVAVPTDDDGIHGMRPGYVIARYRGVGLGVGFRRDGSVESNIPKGRVLPEADWPPLPHRGVAAPTRLSRER